MAARERKAGLWKSRESPGAQGVRGNAWWLYSVDSYLLVCCGSLPALPSHPPWHCHLGPHDLMISDSSLQGFPHPGL